MSQKYEYVKVTTPVFRVSYPQVFSAKEFQNDGKPKFSLEMIFDADCQETKEYKALKNLIGKKMAERFGKDQKKWPKGWKNPLRSAEDKQGDAYTEGARFAKASCKEDSPPDVIDSKGRALTEKDFYAGCYAKCTVAVGSFDSHGNKGVHLLLNNIMKTDDGERLAGGKSSALDDFDIEAPTDEELLGGEGEDTDHNEDEFEI